MHQELYGLFKHKYSKIKLDVIIATDDNALNFLLKYRNELFPDIPISFCGVNNYNDARIAVQPLITGVAEDFDLKSTLDIIKDLFPETDAIAIVAGDAHSTKLNLARMSKLIPQYSDTYSFIHLTNLSEHELVNKLRSLGDGTVVFNLSFWVDRTGRSFNHKEGLTLLSDNCDVPIFTAWHHMIAHGTLGGMAMSRYLQGKYAAAKAVAILNGSRPDDIPVMRKSPNAFLFDYMVLRRFGLSPDDLPADSVLINKPFSLYDEYRHLIWSMTGAFTILIGCIVVMMINITRRRRAEIGLRESEEKYRILIENANDAIFVAQDELVKFANPRTEEISGYSREEGGKITFANLVHPENRDMVLSRHSRRLAGEEPPNTYSFRIIKKSGEELWVQLNAVVIDWEGRPATLNFLRDITEQRKLEAQVQYIQRMESLGTLAGGIAHDFNNLLMGIQGNASLMILDLDSAHPNYEGLKHIEQYVQKGADLTNQLLGFARGGKYEVRPIDINDLINKSSRMFGRTKKEIRIHTKYQEGIWSVDADRSQIEQVLLNLYVNAWQAMTGGGQLYLETENIAFDQEYVKPFQVAPGKFVKTSITDTGAGMDEATRQRIFEPFFTTKEMGRGAGLGLASAYGIIKNHGGFINVYSEKNQGTTFNIYLPASGKKVAEEKDLSDDIIVGTETILLVDDEHMILDVGKRFLNKMGYKVLLAASGKAALDNYRKKKELIDLVVLDMIMPAMSGSETYDSLKAINPQIKVILSSGYSVNEKAQKILDRGCNGFIQKPFNMKQLSRKLREVLDQDKLQRPL